MSFCGLPGADWPLLNGDFEDRLKCERPSMCTVSVDTSDLEAHFEFYRHPQTKCSRTVSTDTSDLEVNRVKTFRTTGCGPDVESELCDFPEPEPFEVLCVKDEPEFFKPPDEATDSDDEEYEAKPRQLRSARKTTKRRLKAKTKPKPASYKIVDDPVEPTIKLSLRKISEQSESDSDAADADYQADGSEPTSRVAAKRIRIKRFECLTCGKKFQGRNDLRDHETVHSGVRAFPCSVCNKSFTTKTILKAHAIVHTDRQPFACGVCAKRFRRNDSLRAHMRQHTNDRPFKCDLCPLAFTRMFTLKNHRVTHSGEKAHICAACGKGFATRGGLGTHERTRHPPPGCAGGGAADRQRKPYKRRERDFTPCVCDQCGKVYSNQSNLRIHKYVHSGERKHVCAVCGAAFATKYTLQCHARKHTNERPFVCETCGQTFYRNSTLKTHTLKHTGEKPHPCALCGKRFRQRCSLRYHLLHHDRLPRPPTAPSARPRPRKTPAAPPPLVIPPDHLMLL